MENMEKATNVNKENRITLSSTEIILFAGDEIVLGKNFSIFYKVRSCVSLNIVTNDIKSGFLQRAKYCSLKSEYI